MKQITFSENLKHIKPERLINKKEDDLADFFLVLGTFFNDLKSLTFHLVQTDNFFEEIEKIDKDIISPQRGEFGGIKTHLVKLTVATVYEFFEFIKNYHSILKKKEFNLIYGRLNKNLRSRWDVIVNITNNGASKDDTDFSKILLLIRNNLAFHYYQSSKPLRTGFIDFFFNDPKKLGNEKAYYSIGNTMSDTRFYYCDAAVTRSMQGQISKKMDYDVYLAKIIKVVEDINFTIVALMKEYLQNRPN